MLYWKTISRKKEEEKLEKKNNNKSHASTQTQKHIRTCMYTHFRLIIFEPDQTKPPNQKWNIHIQTPRERDRSSTNTKHSSPLYWPPPVYRKKNTYTQTDRGIERERFEKFTTSPSPSRTRKCVCLCVVIVLIANNIGLARAHIQQLKKTQTEEKMCLHIIVRAYDWRQRRRRRNTHTLINEQYWYGWHHHHHHQ